MPHVGIFVSQLQKWTINSVFVWGIMHVHYLIPAGAGHQIIQKQLLQGVACGSPDGSMPRGAWTARARPTLLAALIIIIIISSIIIIIISLFVCLSVI